MTKYYQFSEEHANAFEAAALEHYDFRTCQRSDGSYYGTGGQCRKGVEADKPEREPKGKKAGGGGAASLSTKEVAEITNSIGGRSAGDGMLYDEGGDPGESFSKMSQKELKAYVKSEVKAALGADSDSMEYLKENLQEDNPKLAKKLDKVLKANNGEFPVDSVTDLEVYYDDPSDKSVYPGLKGKVNGVPFEMSPGYENYKSQDQSHGLYFGGILN